MSKPFSRVLFWSYTLLSGICLALAMTGGFEQTLFGVLSMGFLIVSRIQLLIDKA